MFDLLITPAAPYVAFAIACLLMAGLGARRRLVLPIGLVPPAHGWDYRQRLVRGQLAGSLVAALVVAAVLAQNVQLELVGPPVAVGAAAASALLQRASAERALRGGLIKVI